MKDIWLIGITGPSCSFKSTVCDKLESQGVGKRLRLDGYYRGEEGAVRLEDGTCNWEDVGSIFADEAAEMLNQIKQGKTPRIRLYDRTQHRPSGTGEFFLPQGHPKIVLVDSIFCLFSPIREMLDRVLYIYLTEEEVWNRRKKRQKEYTREYHEQCMIPALKMMEQQRLVEKPNRIYSGDHLTSERLAAIIKDYLIHMT